jgi:hypothetical protein
MPHPYPETAARLGDAYAVRLEAAVERLAAELDGLGADNARLAQAAPDEWTAMQVLGHMVEMLPHWSREVQRLVASQGGAGLPTFGRTPDDPQRLAGVERGANSRLEDMLPRLRSETQATAAMLRALHWEDWPKRCVHPRLGEMTVEQMVERFIIGHAIDHMYQIFATLAYYVNVHNAEFPAGAVRGQLSK